MIEIVLFFKPMQTIETGILFIIDLTVKKEHSADSIWSLSSLNIYNYFISLLCQAFLRLITMED
jgi:hypothetical protein